LYLAPYKRNMKNYALTLHEGAYDPSMNSSSNNNRRISGNGLTALVVDDNPHTLRFAAAMLQKLGYSILLADEGLEALFHLKDLSCELVLTDFDMPTINGYQLGRKVKSLFTGTRVVIMTGLCQTDVAELMIDASIDGWLFKPFGLEQLKAMLLHIGLPGSAGVKPPID
jgi:CheY-like chemotaxis protein